MIRIGKYLITSNRYSTAIYLQDKRTKRPGGKLKALIAGNIPEQDRVKFALKVVFGYYNNNKKKGLNNG